MSAVTDTHYRLSDRYTRDDGRVFVSGVQALARLPLEQMRVDRLAGLRTAAFVSGYPGSPLAGFDREAEVAAARAGDLTYVHTPALNEELAATAVMGSQLAAERPDCRHDGIIGLWYGKTPGVDRAGDALRHAVFAGVHHRSGAVALVGDDAAAKSSTLPSSADATLVGLHMPILAPADVQETLDLGRHAIALSRASGLWSALKIVAPVADGTGTVDLDLGRVRPVVPTVELDGRVFVPRADGNLLTPHTLDLEREMFEVRLDLALRYGIENRLNEIVVDSVDAWIGIAAPGHTFLEVREALRSLGLPTDADIAAAGIRLLHLRMPSPVDPALLRRFAVGLAEILVVEDKDPTLERTIRDALYSSPDRPVVTGKFDDRDRRLLPSFGALDADGIVGPLRSRLAQRLTDDRLAPIAASSATPATQRQTIPLTVTRTPYFCSGCPHNTSTRVPDGALVGGGIGCHSMVAMMEPDRVGELVGLTCMGNEGAQWVGMAPFVETPHLIQNLGDGTYAHSGQLAVRWAVASGVDITFKILANGVVAMTGGQDPQGGSDVATMARILMLQGVREIVVTTEDVDRYRDVALPSGVAVWDRSRIIEAQEHLAAVGGTTVLIHDQFCAAERRRLRKRDRAATPAFRVIINERVCEGCGDCGEQSNCLSVQPVETEFGRKTRIDQSSCNLDATCLQGDCPSFATVTARRQRPWRRVVRASQASPGSVGSPVPRPLPDMPPPPAAVTPIEQRTEPFVVRMPGIGGTGVVTVAQVLGTAAMLQGYQVRGLDQTGLSQKAGPVVSDLVITAGAPSGSNKAAAGAVDLLLAFDLLGATTAATLRGASADRTIVIGNSTGTPTGTMVLRPALAYPADEVLIGRLGASSRRTLNRFAPATDIVTDLFGDSTSANVFLAGVALQSGALPLAPEHVERAIELNGVAVERNIAALRWGRQWVVDPALLGLGAGRTRAIADSDPVHGDPVARRAADLVAYQSDVYSRRYVEVVDAVRAAGASPRIVDAVARNLHRLMAYKDEYEVARLLLAPDAKAAAVAVAGKGARVTWHLHPPLLRSLGMQHKMRLGRWATPALVALRAGRRLRGTPFDIAGLTSLRRTERRLATEYTATMLRLVREGAPDDLTLAIAELPEMIRGYESIKERNIAAYRTRLAQLLADVASSGDDRSRE